MPNAQPGPDTSVSETYLQISPNILASFPRNKLPVDFYSFSPERFGMRLLYRAGQRVSDPVQAEMQRLSAEGALFLSRKDYRVYAVHLSKNLGLVLTETGLNEQEAAELFFVGLTARVRDFLDQPLEQRLDALRADAAVLAEYVWIDPCRIGFLLRTLRRKYDLAAHSVNSALVGLGLYLMQAGKSAQKLAPLDIVLGLALHDIGMSKVPGFVITKEANLMRQERESIENHVDIALAILERLRVKSEPVRRCVAEHHERFDGSGYPRGLKGGAISLEGRICAIADAFVAMTSERPHRPAMDPARAARTLLAAKGAYDPVLCRMLVELLARGLPQCRAGGEGEEGGEQGGGEG